MFLRRTQFMAVWAALIFFTAPPQGHAQSDHQRLSPDTNRLVYTVAPNLILALPSSARFVDQHSEDLILYGPEAGRRDELDTDEMAMRLRLQPALYWKKTGFLRLVKAGIDASVDGTLLGADPHIFMEVDPRVEEFSTKPRVTLNQAYVTTVMEGMMVNLGLQRSSFGMGLVANAGDDPHPNQVRTNPFALGREGDRNLRFQIAVFPFGVRKVGKKQLPRLAIQLGADAVVKDDRADWLEGDRTWQAIGGLMLSGKLGPAETQVRTGTVYREQTHAEGGKTTVWIQALNTSATIGEDKKRQAWVEAEMAITSGESTYSQSILQPEPLEILALGGVARLGGRYNFIEGVIEGGLATGDDQSFDREAHTFSFDREFQVGLLMFSEVLRASTASAATNVADPTLRGTPPRGYETLATGGAVQNAIYLNPRLGLSFGDRTTLAVGYVYAESEEPLVDAFQSALNGGAATGPSAGTARRVLGHEVDLGLIWRAKLKPTTLIAKAIGGWFRPGDAFADATGCRPGDSWGTRMQLEVRW